MAEPNKEDFITLCTTGDTRLPQRQNLGLIGTDSFVLHDVPTKAGIPPSLRCNEELFTLYAKLYAV